MLCPSCVCASWSANSVAVTTTGPDNGKIFMGAAFPAVVKEAKTVLFPVEAVGDLGSGFVFGVHAATAEQQTGGGQ